VLSSCAVRPWVARFGVPGLLLLLASLTATPALAVSESYDVAALGATAHGKVGDVVKVTVGITSKGPERFVQRGQGNIAQTWKFTLPPGTETVPAPETEVSTIFGSGGAIAANKCNTKAGGDTPFGPGPYGCWTRSILEPGEFSKGTFYLKITKVVPNATGTVERWIDEDSPADSNPDNDQASVVINPDAAVVGSVAGLHVKRLPALGAVVVLLLLCVGGWLYLRRSLR
jgi:hypothetical protein